MRMILALALLMLPSFAHAGILRFTARKAEAGAKFSGKLLAKSAKAAKKVLY